MYEARKICNYLLDRYDAQHFDITNLRLNKLIYFVHAEALVTRPNGLVRNHFEAWQYGPVVRPVFDTFKIHGDRWISAPAKYLDYASGTEKPIPHDDIGSDDEALIRQTFEKYSRFSTNNLVSLSHAQGGPWDVVYRAHLADKTASPRIPNELIRRYHVTGETNVQRN